MYQLDSVYFGGSGALIGYGVVDTGYTRFIIGEDTLKRWEKDLREKYGLAAQRTEGYLAVRFGNDERVETRDVALIPVGIQGISGVFRCFVIPGGAPLLVSKEFLKDMRANINLEKNTVHLRALGVTACLTESNVAPT